MMFLKAAVAALFVTPTTVNARYRMKLFSNGVSGASTENQVDFYIVKNDKYADMSDVVRITYPNGLKYDCDDIWKSIPFLNNIFTELNIDDASVIICNGGSDGLFIDKLVLQIESIGWWAKKTWDADGGNGYCLATTTTGNEFNGKCPNGGVNKCIRFNVASGGVTYGEDQWTDEHKTYSKDDFQCDAEGYFFDECEGSENGEAVSDCSSSAAVVSKWVEKYHLEEINNDKDQVLPLECMDRSYNVGLYAISGTHYFIGAVATDEVDYIKDAMAINKCPSSIAFASIEEEKKIFMAKDKYTMDGITKHPLGTFSLADIIEAEKKAVPIKDAEYDISSNTCVHYAGDIWRSLNIKETDALADFLVSNLIESDEFIDMAKKKAGGIRVAAALAIGGQGALEHYVKNVVTSQLKIE